MLPLRSRVMSLGANGFRSVGLAVDACLALANP